jgi:hypothetical protein
MWHAKGLRQSIKAWAKNQTLGFAMAVAFGVITVIGVLGWAYDEFFKHERPMVEISNAALGGPLLIDDNGLNVKVTTPLENTSGTLAIMKAQDERCDGLQRRVRTGDAVTRTLFHGPESIPLTTLAPLVISCVVYQSVFGRTFYRSAYANMIMKPICNAARICNGGPVPFRPVVINADQLMFAPRFDADAGVE